MEGIDFGHSDLAVGIKAFTSDIVVDDKIASFNDSINIRGSGYILNTDFDRNFHDYYIVST